MDRDQFWLHLEESLTTLVGSMTAELDEINRELLTSFIDNREYGIALEWLYSIVISRKIQLSALQDSEVGRLAELMRIDLSKVVDGE